MKGPAWRVNLRRLIDPDMAKLSKPAKADFCSGLFGSGHISAHNVTPAVAFAVSDAVNDNPLAVAGLVHTLFVRTVK